MTCRGCGLASLPGDLYLLEQLEYLDVSDNMLTKIPMTGMWWLRDLEASGNLLTQLLPEWAPPMTRMVRVSASHNLISWLPVTMDGWADLKHLDISWNQFTRVPDILDRLPQLAGIVVTGNPLCIGRNGGPGGPDDPPRLTALG